MSESLQDVPSQLKNVERDFIKLCYFINIIATLVIGIPLLILAYFQQDNIWIVTAVTLVITFLIFSIFYFPKREYINTKYGLINDVFYLQKGIWFKKRIAVAQNRIQHTDVSQGPLERRYDLATLILHTAGMKEADIRVEGLKHADAVAMRDHLIYLNKQLQNSNSGSHTIETVSLAKQLVSDSLLPDENCMATSVLSLRPISINSEEE